MFHAFIEFDGQRWQSYNLNICMYDIDERRKSLSAIEKKLKMKTASSFAIIDSVRSFGEKLEISFIEYGNDWIVVFSCEWAPIKYCHQTNWNESIGRKSENEKKTTHKYVSHLRFTNANATANYTLILNTHVAGIFTIFHAIEYKLFFHSFSSFRWEILFKIINERRSLKIFWVSNAKHWEKYWMESA